MDQPSNDSDEPAALSYTDLILILGAQPLPADSWDDRPACVECGQACNPIRPGVPTACVDCSVKPLGETWPGLAVRVANHLTRNQWAKLDTTDDLPRLRYREWRKRVWFTTDKGRGT